VEALFNAARGADYAALAKETRALQSRLGRRGKRSLTPGQVEGAVRRLRKRLAEVVEIDFFGAAGRDGVERLLDSIESAQRPAIAEPHSKAPADVRGRTWVTRRGVHIDRIGSAWLIRRFIDPEARFRFVEGHEEAAPGELRFDMFEAEFTHRGDGCTFEVLLEEFEVPDPALRPIAEIVHDIDLKEEKFAREETSGIALVINGIAMNHQEDEMRLSRAAAVFDDLYEYFKRKKA
jgi:hypothetical protein